jgi:cell division septum initiation protein DivIVA
VHNVEYHVSQYTEIITRLKQEVNELKAQLGRGGDGARRNLRPVSTHATVNKMQKPENESLINSYKQMIEVHFNEEIKLKKRTCELE